MGSIDFTSIKTSDLALKSYECTCGRTHRVETQKILLGKNAINMLGDAMSILPAGKVLFISCEDIYDHYGARIGGEILNLGYTLIRHVFPPDFKPTLEHTDQLAEYPEDIRLIVAYGSGSVCDIAKYAARARGVKLIMIPSAPGTSYLSNVSFLYSGNICKSYKTVGPYALLCDLNIIRQAGREMVASAFGELCCRLVTLIDWYFSRCIIGGHHCRSVEELTIQCINMALNSGEGLIADNEFSLYIVSEALIRSSLCTQLLGHDRCVAGSPHYAVQLLKPRQKIRYGEMCMLASRNIMNMYSLFFGSDFADVFMPPNKDLRAMKIAKNLGADPEAVYNISQYNLGEYEKRRKKVEEYKKEFLKLIDLYAAKLNMAWVIYKRIYKDAGAWLDGAIDNREMASAIALAPDLTGDFSVLAHMRDIGILDRYI